MGYTGGKLADIAPEGPLLDAAERTARRSGRLLLERVKHYTPVAKPPMGVELEWVASRGGMPGTLRESWRESDLAFASQAHRYGIDVFTLDPVAAHVEYPTRPHLIYPQHARRLRWWGADGGIHFALLVHHPGTQGSYMMARALADLDREWQQIGDEEMNHYADEARMRI